MGVHVRAVLLVVVVFAIVVVSLASPLVVEVIVLGKVFSAVAVDHDKYNGCICHA